MSFLGRNENGNLVFQQGSVNLRIGNPESGVFDRLIVLDSIQLPAFDNLFVNPSGTSELATVSGDSTWQGNIIEREYGGTGFDGYEEGDLLVGSSGSGLARLPVGSETAALIIEGGLPVWGEVAITGIQGRPVSSGAPASGEVLKWDGSQWAPAVDEDTPQVTSLPVSGDVTGTTGATTVGALQGRSVGNTAPASGEVLKWNGSSWQPAPDNDTQVSSLPLVGDVGGTTDNAVVSGLQGRPVGATAPASGEILKWNGVSWEPAPDEDTPQATSLPVSGDISGTTNSVTVEAIHGRPVTTGAPSSGQILKWNGALWELATDESGSQPTSLPMSGDVTGLTDVSVVTALQGNSVATGVPSSGEVLKWNGAQWSPAPDESGIPITSLSVGGDLSGTTDNATVSGLQNRFVAPSAPTLGQVLTWNGSQWEPDDAPAGSGGGGGGQSEILFTQMYLDVNVNIGLAVLYVMSLSGVAIDTALASDVANGRITIPGALDGRRVSVNARLSMDGISWTASDEVGVRVQHTDSIGVDISNYEVQHVANPGGLNTQRPQIVTPTFVVSSGDTLRLLALSSQSNTNLIGASGSVPPTSVNGRCFMEMTVY